MIWGNLTNPASAALETQRAQSASLMRQLHSAAEVDPSKLTDKQKAELRKTCQDFEGLFVKMLLDTMRKSIHHTALETGSSKQSREIYEEMLYDEYAKKLSHSGELGIGAMIYRQLTTPVISAAEIAKRYTHR